MTVPLNCLRRIVAAADRIKEDRIGRPDSFSVEFDGIRATIAKVSVGGYEVKLERTVSDNRSPYVAT